MGNGRPIFVLFLDSAVNNTSVTGIASEGTGEAPEESGREPSSDGDGR